MNRSLPNLCENVENNFDLFIVAAEPSADLHGANLIQEILKIRPYLKIGAVAGPKMRSLPIKTFFPMENLSVMGFLDVLFELPKIIRQFFKIRTTLLKINPKAIVFIDYPGFNLRMEKSIRKKGYLGKIAHYISPTVWVWGKGRVEKLVKTVDLLLTFFPFERRYFAMTSLNVQYVGHPLITNIPKEAPSPRKKILALFPGSRKKEIERNFPLQLQTAKRLLALDPELKIGVSVANKEQEEQLRYFIQDTSVLLYSPDRNYELMANAQIALATSGTVTLELALHGTPTIVHYAIHPIDLFIAQKILSINLPFYCIVNILVSQLIFPELFGPHFTEKQLFFWTHKLWLKKNIREKMRQDCKCVRRALGEQNANLEAAKTIISLAF